MRSKEELRRGGASRLQKERGKEELIRGREDVKRKGIQRRRG